MGDTAVSKASSNKMMKECYHKSKEKKKEQYRKNKEQKRRYGRNPYVNFS